MSIKSMLMAVTIICLFTSCYLISYGKDDRKARVIVICDASGSIAPANSNNKGLEQLKYYVKKIPKWDIYPFGSEIYYYPVSNVLTSPLLGGNKVSYNIQMRSQLNKEKRRIDSLLDKVGKGIDVSYKETKNSCILLSINRAIDKFYEIKIDQPDDSYKNELIIISDLLEYCEQPDKKNIDMTLTNLSKLDVEIQKFTKQHANMSVPDLNLKVRVIFNTPGMGPELNKIQSAWAAWFYSIGIKKEDLIFYTGEPEIKENTQLK